MTLTKAQEKLKAAMLAAVASGAWAVVDGDTIRWESPLYTMSEEFPVIGGWSKPYNRMVFLSFRHRILGVCSAPWMGRQDSKVTFKRAHEVLSDPTILFAGYRTPELAEAS